MRTVRLWRNAYVNETYCTVGTVVTIPDGTALAPFMEVVTPPAPAAPIVPQHHEVSVRYREHAGEIDITVDGVETRLDHAELKLRMD